MISAMTYNTCRWFNDNSTEKLRKNWSSASIILSDLQTFLEQCVDKPDAFLGYCGEYCDNFPLIFQTCDSFQSTDFLLSLWTSSIIAHCTGDRQTLWTLSTLTWHSCNACATHILLSFHWWFANSIIISGSDCWSRHKIWYCMLFSNRLLTAKVAHVIETHTTIGKETRMWGMAVLQHNKCCPCLLYTSRCV